MPSPQPTAGPLIRLYRRYLKETGSEIAAAIFALDANRTQPANGGPLTNPSADAEYLTVKQAAKRLQVSERTIARMIDKGLRVTRAGKTVRIRPADLEQHLEEQDTRFD
jgi:excisionase family DNA binding protein